MQALKVEAKKHRQKFLLVCGFFLILAIGYLIWKSAPIWPPVIAGVILAYVFRPLKAKFHLPWIPHEVAVVLAFSFTVLIFSVLFFKVKSVIPTDQQKTEIKVRLDYKIHEKFQEVFQESNSFMETLGTEIEPALKSVSGLLALSPSEIDFLEKRMISAEGLPEKFQAYYKANLDRKRGELDVLNRDPSALVDETILEGATSPGKASITPAKPIKKNDSHSNLLQMISVWMICPLVFIFLIFDSGQVRRFAVSLVPNTYFELTLTLMDRVDEAVGSYLRGTALECFLVGITTFFGLILIGVPVPVALLLALICGPLNAVPFLGPLIGALFVLGYALIAEEIHPPFGSLRLEHLPIASMIVIGFAQFMDNICYAPIVLGRAVNLHPLVVILSLSAASMAFGVMGVVLTIPLVVVIKTVVQCLVEQLKAYKLI